MMAIHLELDKKITFITSSIGSKWESYSQSLIKINFPECRRIVVDGSQNWDPLYFVSHVKKVDTDYLVLVDEDCFLFDRQQLLELIKWMESHDNCGILATPDGGTYHRDYNPIACNTFFAIFRTVTLKKVTQDNAWRELKYNNIVNDVTTEHLSSLDLERISYDKLEPYYPVFWACLKNKFTIRYIIPTLNMDLLASEVFVNGAVTPMLTHMWWLRSWNSKEIEPYLKVSNFERYEVFENIYLKKMFSRRSNLMILMEQNLIRNTKKKLRIMMRLLCRAAKFKNFLARIA